jgi:hypothetical protein
MELPPAPLPAIILHDFSHDDDFPMDEDVDPIITNNPTFHDITDSQTYDYSEPSAFNCTEQSGSGISAHPPPSSGGPSEVNSAVTSDSDLPPPPPLPLFKPSKSIKQTGLSSFFSTIPAEQANAAWGKRKRENREMEDEKRAKVKRREEEWKEEKLLEKREGNRLSQQKRRDKIKQQEVKAGIRGDDGKKLQVS